MKYKNNRLYINIGCGPTGQIDGFENLDNSLAVLLAKSNILKILLYKLNIISSEKYHADWSSVKWCNVSKGLHYSNGSVDKIYSSHFLEHIPQDKGLFVLGECFRILKPGGVFRIVVPDMLWYASKYVQCTIDLVNGIDLSDNRSYHDDFINTICGAYLSKSRFGLGHSYMYDLPTLVSMLKYVGFRHIKKCEYQQGDEELARYDSRPIDSLHLEVIR
jgi:SAM-dependent methyltransferase